MREQLYYYLQNYAGLTALIGANIFPQRVPTGKALPTLAYTFSGRQPEYDQDGLDGENEVTVEFNCNASTLGGAVAVADQLYLAMAIQNDATFGELGNYVTLYSTTLETEFDNFDLFDGSEDGTRIVTQTYTLRYK
tara:strand:+ start:56 stop:463 length:408 start_codon:yes stop_codon:yes gene_type:complete